MTKNKSEAKSSRVTVSKVFSHNKEIISEEESQETLQVRIFETAPAVVGLDYGVTINLGNFNSAKVNVSIQMPCYVEEIDQAYSFAEAWATSRVDKEAKLIKAQADKKVTHNW